MTDPSKTLCQCGHWQSRHIKEGTTLGKCSRLLSNNTTSCACLSFVKREEPIRLIRALSQKLLKNPKLGIVWNETTRIIKCEFYQIPDGAIQKVLESSGRGSVAYPRCLYYYKKYDWGFANFFTSKLGYRRAVIFVHRMALLNKNNFKNNFYSCKTTSIRGTGWYQTSMKLSSNKLNQELRKNYEHLSIMMMQRNHCIVLRTPSTTFMIFRRCFRIMRCRVDHLGKDIDFMRGLLSELEVWG